MTETSLHESSTEFSRIVMSNMLVNTNLALYPIKEAKLYGTGTTITPHELVNTLKQKAMRNIEDLVVSMTNEGCRGLGQQLLDGLFKVGYSFPNTHALKLIESVTDMDKRSIPFMSSYATLEGEGPEIGKPTILARLGGCAVRCKGCDTPNSWNANAEPFDGTIDPMRNEYNQLMHISDIADLIVQQADCYGLKRISITGGEPLHYIDALRLLIADLWLRGFYINLETSGTLFDPVIFAMCHVSVDIKTPSSKVKLSEYQIGALHAIASYDHANPAHIKAVILNKKDLAFVLEKFPNVLKGHGTYRPICLTPWAAARQEDLNVGSMSSNVQEITNWIFDNKNLVDTRQVRVIGQQHKLFSFA